MGDISDHFSKWEIQCQCGCGRLIVNPLMVHRLELVRSYTDEEMDISSWCRCEDHNRDVGGIDGSEHITGEGVDVFYVNIRQLLTYLFVFPLFGFQRVVVYKGRLHVGIKPSRHQPYFEIKNEVIQWLTTS